MKIKFSKDLDVSHPFPEQYGLIILVVLALKLLNQSDAVYPGQFLSPVYQLQSWLLPEVKMISWKEILHQPFT